MRAVKSHTVRVADGETTTLEGYGRRLAILAMCTECLGWETHPRDCTATLCPLYPFRGRTTLTRKAQSPALNGGETGQLALQRSSQGDEPSAANRTAITP